MKRGKAVVMYGVVLYNVGGGWRSAGQIIRPVVRDEGWPTCKQVTSVRDDNS